MYTYTTVGELLVYETVAGELIHNLKFLTAFGGDLVQCYFATKEKFGFEDWLVQNVIVD
jgi:hypothetical protein